MTKADAKPQPVVDWQEARAVCAPAARQAAGTVRWPRHTYQVMRASTCHDGLRRQAVGGERMDGEVFFSGLIFGVSVGVVLGYCLPHRLPPREEQQPEIERLIEHFQELFRQIDREKER
jgi:hypothetical protein